MKIKKLRMKRFYNSPKIKTIDIANHAHSLMAGSLGISDKPANEDPAGAKDHIEFLDFNGNDEEE